MGVAASGSLPLPLTSEAWIYSVPHFPLYQQKHLGNCKENQAGELIEVTSKKISCQDGYKQLYVRDV